MSDKEYAKYSKELQACLTTASKKKSTIKNTEIRKSLDTIIKHSESKKGVLAVTMTSLIKKSIDPKQDIRYHQSKMQNGYSGRTLDTKVITPFLKSNQFPAMAESGWLTRTLEQGEPYTLDYKGAITPKGLKTAFLHILESGIK